MLWCVRDEVGGFKVQGEFAVQGQDKYRRLKINKTLLRRDKFSGRLQCVMISFIK